MRAASPRRKPNDNNAPLDENVTPLDVFNTITFYTSPGFSLPFILLFILATYFHESHFTPTGIAVGIWILLQFASFVIKEDFRNDLFWSIFGLIGNLIFYLFIGYFWSLTKLYLDIWQGHLDPELIAKIRTCISTDGKEGCVFSFLSEMKWFIVSWMVTWPVSVAYTISRDPFRVITDFIFEISRRRYLSIITAALYAHDSTDIQDTDLLTIILYIFGYFVIGFIWSHLKLFIDVWQKSLPPSLEEEVRNVYRGDKNYWNFALSIKWLVIQWLITWPFSIVYTILRHPVRILADFVYKLSQRKYVWIISKAMEAREKKE